MGRSFTLTHEQREALAAAKLDPRRQLVGMAKWEIQFTDGTHSTMLTNDCRDRASALIGAIERFGKKVVNVK